MISKNIQDPIFKSVYSLEKWKNGGRSELLNTFLNEEYGVRGEFFASDSTYRKVNEIKLNNLIVESYLMNTRGLDMRFFIIRPNKDGIFKSFLFIMHEFVENSVNGDILKNLDSIPAVPVLDIINRGYALIIMPTRDIAPDLSEHYFEKSNDVFEKFDINNIKGNKSGTLQAWSIGASKIMDFLQSVDYLDKDNIAIIGHSRGGKTALLTAAQDERFKLAVSSCSGCSGAALSRGAKGETIKDILNHYPYWFCKNYNKYIANEDKLPFDQHQLIGLIAPRYVYIFSATEDKHASPENELLACKYASLYFELYNKNGLVVEDKIKNDVSYNKGHIAYHIKTGNHCINYNDWMMIMDYFDKI